MDVSNVRGSRLAVCHLLAILAIVGLSSAALADEAASGDVQYVFSALEQDGGAGCVSSPCCSCHNDPCAALLARLETSAKCLEERGIIYDPSATQFYQGVTSGGAEQEFEYGGKVDQFLILDGTKLCVWQGMTMTLHAETRFGEDSNFDAVGFAPVNVAMLYPKEGEPTTAITGLTFEQMLSDDVSASFGKINALDMFYSLYPETGRGINGFMNASMVVPLSVARVVSLSFMGAGLTKYQDKKAQGGILVYDTHNVPTTSGFEDLFDNGANILGFWRFFTDVNGLPGSHYFAGIWSTGEFVSFDPTGFVIVPDEGLVVPRQHGAFSLLYIFEQTLWMDCANPKRNVTLLSQWGLADKETSPIHWTANVGIQGTGFNCARPQDSFGVGYFHTGLSSDFKNTLSPFIDLHDVDGVELYYNAALAKYLHVTADFQVIDPADQSNDTAIVFGLRATVGM